MPPIIQFKVKMKDKRTEYSYPIILRYGLIQQTHTKINSKQIYALFTNLAPTIH